MHSVNTVLLFNEWTLQRGSMLFSSLTSTVTSIFHSIILVYKLSPLDWKKFKNHLDSENYDLESNDSRNVLSRCRLKLLDFSHTMYKIVSYVKDFVPFKFLLNFYLKNLEKCNVWPVISLKQSRWPIYFIVSFETDISREHLRKD